MSDESCSESASDSDDNDPRKDWKPGSLVEVYSKSSKEWKNGTITKAWIDKGIKLLKVRYLSGNNIWSIKNVNPYNEELIRPMSIPIDTMDRTQTVENIEDEKAQDTNIVDESEEKQSTESKPRLSKHQPTVMIIPIPDELNEEKSENQPMKAWKRPEPSIIQYLGRVIRSKTKTYDPKSDESKSDDMKYYTGTVFDYDHKHNKAFVITSADIVVQCKNIFFQGKRRTYPCRKIKIHPKALASHDSLSASHNIAVLIFKDESQDYKNMFIKNNKKVELRSSYTIPGQFTLTFEIFGCTKNSPLGERIVTAKNFDKDTKKEIKKSKDGHEFLYPAIDDVKDGMDGAVIAMPLRGGKYGIVGINTRDRSGVALSNKKCEWINKHVPNNNKIAKLSRFIPSDPKLIIREMYTAYKKEKNKAPTEVQKFVNYCKRKRIKNANWTHCKEVMEEMKNV